ncbi:hypothetical protein LTR17_017034 [Elasticomyces elasticus]|nr:hypothetical protein LTR17_017034 [Elasticomyces elasticus]
MADTNGSINAVKGKTFLDLPAEICNNIYALALSGPSSNFTLCRPFKMIPNALYPHIPSLLNTHQQIALEALPMFFAQNHFDIFDPADKELFTSSVRGCIAKKHMQSIEIREWPHGNVHRNSLRVKVRMWRGELEIAMRDWERLLCACKLQSAVREKAARRVDASAGETGVVYAAMECVVDEHLPYLLDTPSRFAPSTCRECRDREFRF